MLMPEHAIFFLNVSSIVCFYRLAIISIFTIGTIQN